MAESITSLEAVARQVDRSVRRLQAAARRVGRSVRRLQAAAGRSKASSCDRTESERENVRVIRGSWASIGLEAVLNVLAVSSRVHTEPYPTYRPRAGRRHGKSGRIDASEWISCQLILPICQSYQLKLAVFSLFYSILVNSVLLLGTECFGTGAFRCSVLAFHNSYASHLYTHT